MLVAFLVLVVTCIAQAAPNNCTTQYQAALQQVLDLKETCTEAVYKDCCEASKTVKFGAEVLGSTPPASGIYEINHVCGEESHVFHTSVPALQARCSNGGWTIILRRNASVSVSQQVNFTRTWNDYKHGFGDLNTEFWYGLNNIHCLTSRQQVDLRIEMTKGDGTQITYNYKYFVVDGPEDKFKLHVGRIQQPSPGRDNMVEGNGLSFSTYEEDNDRWSQNCALDRSNGIGGGWWYNACGHIALTRPHPHCYWYTIGGGITYVEMKIRPKQCAV